MFELIRANKRRSVLLVVAFIVIVALVGAAIGAVVGNGIVFTLVALVILGGIKRIGKVEWTARVMDALEQLEPIFNYDVLHLGGGNTLQLKSELPENVRIFSLAEAMRGALKLWDGL